ncbi:MAG: YcxB family protein [Cytophagales bacterium]|nr:YcxB family protein [Cytophagales bacterium]
MRITTKPSVLPLNIYMKECFWNILNKWWWINLIIIVGVVTALYFSIMWLCITCIVLYVLYILFLFVNLYAVRILPHSKVLFDKLYFEFYEDKIILRVNNGLGMPVDWMAIRKVKKRKKYYLFFLSDVQVFYVSKNSFNSPFEQQIFENLLASRGFSK